MWKTLYFALRKSHAGLVCFKGRNDFSYLIGDELFLFISVFILPLFSISDLNSLISALLMFPFISGRYFNEKFKCQMSDSLTFWLISID